MHGLGSVGPQSTRAFTPAFLVAMLIRFGDYIPLLNQTEFVEKLHGEPTWFTHNITLVVLGVLALAEVIATKNSDVRAFMKDFQAYLKTGVAALTYLGLVTAYEANFMEEGMTLPAAVSEAGAGDTVAGILLAAMVFFLATMQKHIAALFVDYDEEDATGLQSIASWLADFWAVGGMLLVVLFPILMVAMLAVAMILLVVVRYQLRKAEEAAKVACTSCDRKIFPCAVACPHCDAAVKQPRAVGLLGVAMNRPAGDLHTHGLNLIAHKRCPRCATRLNRRCIAQQCTACGQAVLEDAEAVDRYLTFLTWRLPMVLGITFLMSLIPVAGLIAAVIYFKLTLTGPLQQYIPLAANFVTKWALRGASLLLIAFQWVPGAGGLVAPAMAAMGFYAYRRILLRQLPQEEEEAVSDTVVA